MKRIVILFVCVLLAHAVFAEKSSASSSELVLQISSLPEAKLVFNQSFKVPFLQADNSLMEGNNISFVLSAQATPVSFDGLIKTVLTPIAFLQFSAGGRFGMIVFAAPNTTLPSGAVYVFLNAAKPVLGLPV